MNDTYKGESPAKKLARLEFWQRMVLLLKDDFFERKHVVLASREGGDLSVLKGLGVDLANVVAVDRVESAVAACREKFPEADVRHGDVEKIVQSMSGNIGVVFLDFCSPICRDTLLVVKRTLDAMKPRSVLAVGLLRGRETDADDAFKIAPMNRATRLAMRSAYRKLSKKSNRTFGVVDNVIGMKDFSARDLASVHVGQENQSPGERRAFAIRDAINVNPHYTSPNEVTLYMTIDYSSKTKESRGVPMTIAVFNVRPAQVPVRDDRNRLRFDEPLTSSTCPTYYRAVVAADEEDIRDCAIELSMDFRAPELLLNVPKSTVTAWKAHATRGSYDAEE